MKKQGCHKHLQIEFQELKVQVNVLQMAMGRVGSSFVDKGKRAKVPKPRRYERQAMSKSLKISYLTLSNTFGS